MMLRSNPRSGFSGPFPGAGFHPVLCVRLHRPEADGWFYPNPLRGFHWRRAPEPQRAPSIASSRSILSAVPVLLRGV